MKFKCKSYSDIKKRQLIYSIRNSEALFIPCSHVTRVPRCESMIVGQGLALVAVSHELEGGARVGRGHEGSFRGKSPRWGQETRCQGCWECYVR